MTRDLATSEIWEIGELKPDEFSYSFHLGRDEVTQEQLREAFHPANRVAIKNQVNILLLRLAGREKFQK